VSASAPLSIWRFPFMSDAAIPDRYGPAIRWAIAGIALFVFFLLGAEEFKDGKYVSGGIFAALFIVTFVIAVKWEQIAAFLGRDKVTLTLIGVGMLCALGLGLVIGALITRGSPTDAPKSTGRIEWNFKQMDSGQANFLNMIRLNQEEIRVVGIGAHGKNTSKDPITEFIAYVRSDLTNARLQIFIMAQNPDAPVIPTPFQPEQIPTRPEQTFGIPGLAEFDIVTYESAVMVQGVSGVPVSQFLREFGSFTMVLEYDGIKVERQFSNEKIKAAIETFERSLNPQRTTIPRVTRRPDATPPLQPVLPFPPPAPNPPPARDSN
jgi:hypothetical protein